jgi:hypothetical protein
VTLLGIASIGTCVYRPELLTVALPLVIGGWAATKMVTEGFESFAALINRAGETEEDDDAEEV